MTRVLMLITALALAGCRGEPVPRDYQNNPPGMTNPADNPREVPAPESSTVVPESATGAEGTSGPYEPTKPPASGKELRRVPPDTAPP